MVTTKTIAVCCSLIDPICAIEIPERLSSCYENLKRYNLVERCLSVPVREGTEDEITLVHSLDYLEVVKNTQKMSEEELRKASANYDAVFFHPITYHCAKLAVGATLQLVDAVMSGTTRNGMALVRPPGHHSQRDAANGFCVFNNVAIAAKYTQRKYDVQRVLIVDWDVHHGQGIQYIFEEDPRPQVVYALLLPRKRFQQIQVGGTATFLQKWSSVWDSLVEISSFLFIGRLQWDDSGDLVGPDPGTSLVLWPEVACMIVKIPL
ncbi:UNVERIFIED_CONTAM: Histone deacetylase 10 [Gekko kuhli]